MVIACGCVKAPPLHALKGSTLDEEFRIHYWSYEDENTESIDRDLLKALKSVEHELSSYRPGSMLAQFNRQTSSQDKEVGVEIAALVRRAKKIHKASLGCYDLTSEPLLDLWGISHGQLLDPDDSDIQRLLKNSGMEKLEVLGDRHLKKHVSSLKVDLSSVLLGVSVDRIIEVFERYRVVNYHVVIGSKVAVRGRKPNGVSWRARIDRPVLGQEYLDKIVTINTMSALALATSSADPTTYTEESVYENPTLDPRTGQPVAHHTVSVTVFSSDPVKADAWSSALLCLGWEKGEDVANENGIPAFFINHGAEGIEEFYSSSLRMLSGLRID